MSETFWDHLEELRKCLIRIILAVVICGVAAFFLRSQVFALIMAPHKADFITFQLLSRLITNHNLFSSGSQISDIAIINTGIANQFLVHLRVSLYVGFLCACPYVLYVLFGFISPALYKQEKAAVLRTTISGYMLFLLGVTINYLIIFPFSVFFLGNYQVSSEVVNMIDLNSYINMFLMLSLMLGLMFELPILCAMMGRLGIVNAKMLKYYRRHFVVAILIVAAFITPTGDPFTLLLVAMPIYLLYEISILIVRRIDRKNELSA